MYGYYKYRSIPNVSDKMKNSVEWKIANELVRLVVSFDLIQPYRFENLPFDRGLLVWMHWYLFTGSYWQFNDEKKKETYPIFSLHGLVHYFSWIGYLGYEYAKANNMEKLIELLSAFSQILYCNIDPWLVLHGGWFSFRNINVSKYGLKHRHVVDKTLTRFLRPVYNCCSIVRHTLKLHSFKFCIVFCISTLLSYLWFKNSKS